MTHAGGTLQNVLFELVRRVVDALRGLRPRQRAVNAARGFGRVTPQEGALVEQKHAAAVFQDCVCRGEAGEATADDDDLFAHSAWFGLLYAAVSGCPRRRVCCLLHNRKRVAAATDARVKVK